MYKMSKHVQPSKHVQNVKARTKCQNMYKMSKHVQNIKTCTKYQNMYKMSKTLYTSSKDMRDCLRMSMKKNQEAKIVHGNIHVKNRNEVKK